MKFVFFSIKSDILLKKHKLHLSRLFGCNHTCYCINIASVTSASRHITSASRYHSPYQSRSSMYSRGLIPGNVAELAEAVPNDILTSFKIATRTSCYIFQKTVEYTVPLLR